MVYARAMKERLFNIFEQMVVAVTVGLSINLAAGRIGQAEYHLNALACAILVAIITTMSLILISIVTRVRLDILDPDVRTQKLLPIIMVVSWTLFPFCSFLAMLFFGTKEMIAGYAAMFFCYLVVNIVPFFIPDEA